LIHDTSASSSPSVPVPVAPTAEAADPAKSTPAERVGRTGWDILSEFRSRSRVDHPPTNWYKGAFFLILLAGGLYGAYILREGFDQIKSAVVDVSRSVDSMREHSSTTAAAATRLERQFEALPSMAVRFIPQDADVPTCKARALDVLSRQNVQTIDASQQNAVTGRMPSGSAGTLNVLVICTPHKVAFTVVSGRGDGETERARDAIGNELFRIAAIEAARAASAPATSGSRPTRAP
jgi:hypothetical protein